METMVIKLAFIINDLQSSDTMSHAYKKEPHASESCYP